LYSIVDEAVIVVISSQRLVSIIVNFKYE